jgi:hypothetical protein
MTFSLNKVNTPNPARSRWFQLGCRGRGAGDPQRSASSHALVRLTLLLFLSLLLATACRRHVEPEDEKISQATPRCLDFRGSICERQRGIVPVHHCARWKLFIHDYRRGRSLLLTQVQVALVVGLGGVLREPVGNPHPVAHLQVLGYCF